MRPFRHFWRIAYLVISESGDIRFRSLRTDHIAGPYVLFDAGWLKLPEADITAYRSRPEAASAREVQNGSAVALSVILRSVSRSEKPGIVKAKRQRVRSVSVPLVCGGRTATDSTAARPHRMERVRELRLQRAPTGVLQPCCIWHASPDCLELAEVADALGIPVEGAEISILEGIG